MGPSWVGKNGRSQIGRSWTRTTAARISVPRAGRLMDLLEQRGVAAAQVPSLRREPVAERGAVLDLQSVEEITAEQGREFALSRSRLDTFSARSHELERFVGGVADVDVGEPGSVRPEQTALPE